MVGLDLMDSCSEDETVRASVSWLRLASTLATRNSAVEFSSGVPPPPPPSVERVRGGRLASTRLLVVWLPLEGEKGGVGPLRIVSVAIHFPSFIERGTIQEKV